MHFPDRRLNEVASPSASATDASRVIHSLAVLPADARGSIPNRNLRGFAEVLDFLTDKIQIP